MLDSKVAVKSSIGKPWWVLKERKGVKLKPFSSQNTSLDILLNNYKNLHGTKQKEFFRAAISEDVLMRANKNSFVLENPHALEIIEKSYGRKYVEEAVKNHMAFRPPIERFSEGTEILKNIGKYLSEGDKERLMKEVLNFIISEEELKTFQSVLPESEYNEALKKFQTSHKKPINRTAERLKCLKRWLSIP